MVKKKKLIMKLISDLYAAKELLDAAYDEISILEKALDMQREAAKLVELIQRRLRFLGTLPAP